MYDTAAVLSPSLSSLSQKEATDIPSALEQWRLSVVPQEMMQLRCPQMVLRGAHSTHARWRTVQGLEGLIHVYTLREVPSTGSETSPVPVTCHLESSLCVLVCVSRPGACFIFSRAIESKLLSHLYTKQESVVSRTLKWVCIGSAHAVARCPTDKRGYLWKLIITRK